MIQEKSELCRKIALSVGFDACRIARLSDFSDLTNTLNAAFFAGYFAEMSWLDNPKRAHPQKLFPEAKSALVCALNYAPEIDPLIELASDEKPYISVYARNEDYHDVCKKRLRQAAEQIQQSIGGEVKIFVDTAPLAEKPLAQLAGLGWQGKHTNLVSRTLGSWFFLAVILISEELQPDMTEVDRCGKCQKCLQICPTDAFVKPYLLDARKCVSYLTIEHPGMLPPELAKKFGHRIYGCDDCLAVCPWNKFAKDGRDAAFSAREVIKNLSYREMLEMSDENFRAAFSKSPIKRIKRKRFLRNLLNAAANMKKTECLPAARTLSENREEEPLIRASAVRAIFSLSTDKAEKERLLELYRNDPDPLLREESLRLTAIGYNL